MDLDFETNKYDLFDDWHQNKTKQTFTQKLQQQAQLKKHSCHSYCRVKI